MSRMIHIPAALTALVLLSAAPAIGQSSQEEGERNPPRPADTRPQQPQQPERPSLRRRPRPADRPADDRRGEDRKDPDRTGEQPRQNSNWRFDAFAAGPGSRE